MIENLLLLSGFTVVSYAVLGLLSARGLREERKSQGL